MCVLPERTFYVATQSLELTESTLESLADAASCSKIEPSDDAS
jgi:hypothetical protein